MTLWKGKVTSNDRESKGHFESLGSADVYRPKLGDFGDSGALPRRATPHKSSKPKTLKNSDEFIDDRFDDVSCSQKKSCTKRL